MRRRTHTIEPAGQRNLLLRPPGKNARQKLRDFFWDKEAKTCLTRTPVNWMSITLYYTLFLLVIVLVFYVSMLISEKVSSRDSDRPQYLLGDSPIGTTPRINFFPVKGSRNLIWLSEHRSYNDYVQIISDEFRSYKEKNSSFNTEAFGSCATPPFGYNERAPCIFFRINRILLWKPNPFINGDELPDEMPKEAKNMIGSSATPKVWMTCNGTTAKDRDHIAPDFFQFQGGSGFDTSGYPFERQNNFVDPIVALKFNDSEAKKIIYSFTCVLWAKELDSSKARVDVTYYFE